MSRVLKIRRIIAFLLQVVFIFVAFVLQTSILPIIPIFNCIPNLMLVLVSGYALIYGEQRGMILGVIAGLLLDSFHSENFGIFTLTYSLIGFTNGYFGRRVYEDNIIFRIYITALSELVFNLLIYFIIFVFRSNFNFIYYFFSIILPKMIFTCIFAVLFGRYFMFVKARVDEQNYAAHKIYKVKQKKEIEVIWWLDFYYICLNYFS